MAYIEFINVSKHFPSSIANDNVSFTIQQNSIHGIVGENGAGKSTIMKILYGMMPPSGGEIRFKEERVQFKSPQDAIKLGIGMVHQHFMLIPNLSVWENVILGLEKSYWLQKTKAKAKLAELAEHYGLSISIDSLVSSLSVGQKQTVEILKLLYRNSEVFILDEPTAVLTPQETKMMFAKIRALKDSGKTIIIITHKISEILELTDFVTVMRKGVVVTTLPTQELNVSSLSAHIVGREMPESTARLKFTSHPPELEVTHISTDDEHCPLRYVSLTVGQGEILGVAGISGNGQEELIDAIMGLTKITSGQINFQSEPLSGTPRSRRKLGMGIIPPDRLNQGIISEISCLENSIMGFEYDPVFFPYGWASQKSAYRHCLKIQEDFDVTPKDPYIQCGKLSGGNQQKLIVGRELSHSPKLILAAYPTRGVDIGAISRIHNELIKRRNQGAAILLISSELDELLVLSDRIAVFFRGRIQGTVDRALADVTQLGQWMLGT